MSIGAGLVGLAAIIAARWGWSGLRRERLAEVVSACRDGEEEEDEPVHPTTRAVEPIEPARPAAEPDREPHGLTEPDALRTYKIIDTIVGELLAEGKVERTPKIDELLQDLSTMVIYALKKRGTLH